MWGVGISGLGVDNRVAIGSTVAVTNRVAGLKTSNVVAAATRLDCKHVRTDGNAVVCDKRKAPRVNCTAVLREGKQIQRLVAVGLRRQLVDLGTLYVSED